MINQNRNEERRDGVGIIDDEFNVERVEFKANADVSWTVGTIETHGQEVFRSRQNTCGC